MKKILILGGSSDIAKPLLNLYLKQNKYKIHIHYNSRSKFLKKLSKKNKSIKLIQCNFKYASPKELKKKFSNYDIIVNLVALIQKSSFEKISLKTLFTTIKVNSLIPWIIMKSSIKRMKKYNWGRIINTSSVGTKFGGSLNNFEYSLSKYINNFIPKYLRSLSSNNILYNVVTIGVTNTKLHKKFKNKNMASRVKLIPIRRMAKTDEIAELIFFLSSNKNTYISCENISISGGE